MRRIVLFLKYIQIHELSMAISVISVKGGGDLTFPANCGKIN
jgi:hypothetical protein